MERLHVLRRSNEREHAPPAAHLVRVRVRARVRDRVTVRVRARGWASS